MFKDTFEPAGPSPRTASIAQAPFEQSFWRIVRSDSELTRVSDQLKTRGRFLAVTAGASNYMRYKFVWGGQERGFDAQITGATNATQIRNFFVACGNGLNGKFEQPNIRPYVRAGRRPL